MDHVIEEILTKIIPDCPKAPTRETLPWFSPETKAVQDPLKKPEKTKLYGSQLKETFPHRPQRMPTCPCKSTSDSDSCADERYLTKLMTSKDVLFPPVDDTSIKPTESEILSRFTAAEIQEYREVFDYFDIDCKNFITASYVATKMRTLKETAILPETIQLMKDISWEGNGKITFPEFLRLVARSKIHIDRAKKLRAAFQIMDPKLTGYIPAHVLRFELINLGEILTDEQVDLMIPQLDINDNGMVYYEDLVQLLARKEEDSEEDFFEEEGFETGSLYEKWDGECIPNPIESSSSGLLDKYRKEKEDEIKAKAKQLVEEWDNIMEVRREKKSDKKPETRDVGV